MPSSRIDHWAPHLETLDMFRAYVGELEVSCAVDHYYGWRSVNEMPLQDFKFEDFLPYKGLTLHFGIGSVILKDPHSSFFARDNPGYNSSVIFSNRVKGALEETFMACAWIDPEEDRFYKGLVRHFKKCLKKGLWMRMGTGDVHYIKDLYYSEGAEQFARGGGTLLDGVKRTVTLDEPK